MFLVKAVKKHDEEAQPNLDKGEAFLAENAKTTYVAYVSEQNLLRDETGQPCRHPQVDEIFEGPEQGRYRPKLHQAN